MIPESLEQQWLRCEVHQMAERGVAVAVIASTLGLGARRVYRWLEKSCPTPPPRPTLRSTAWRSSAICRDFDPGCWVGVGEDDPDECQIFEAKRLCAMCPVRQACLTEALNCQETEGIWGGLTGSERQELITGQIPAA